MNPLLIIFVHLAALIPAILWFFVPKARQRVSRFVLPGFAGLVCFLIAEWNYEWIGRWDLMVNKLLIKVAPQLVVTSAKTIGPTFYLLAAWLLGFALTFQGILIWSQKTRPEKRS